MLDDLFVPQDVEDLVVEVVGTNVGSRMDGINIVNMVQQAFLIMEQLAAIPKSMLE
jgi:hypothetical protein